MQRPIFENSGTALKSDDNDTLFHTLLKHSPIAIFYQDLDLRYTNGYNLPAGLDGREITGKTEQQLFSSEDAVCLERIKRSVLKNGVGTRQEAWIRTNGEARYFDLTVEPLCNSDGDIAGLVSIAIDITERKRAEDGLRLASKIFESTAEGIFVTDAQAQIILVNKAFSTITGYSFEEAIGQSALQFQSDQRDEEFFRQLWDSLAVIGQWQGEIWNRRKDGEIYPEWLTLSVVRDETGDVSNYVVILRDITARKQAEERLNFLATHDPLTELPNRELFHDRLNQALARSRRNRQVMNSKMTVAVMLLDLDHFKEINDSLGHAQGDLLLIKVAERLKHCIRQCDTVARMGGDEFTLVMENLTSPEDSKIIAQKILKSLAEPLILDKGKFYITASLGISLFPQDGENVEALLKNADIAMYQAKETRNSFHLYSPDEI
jgi:diguanylate cyclase (GGDEF)-like protein/PAS domain S-box-containing protein